jgi:hypothetical protein
MAKSGNKLQAAAARLAAMMAVSLSHFSQAEQVRRLKAMHKISLGAGAQQHENLHS